MFPATASDKDDAGNKKARRKVIQETANDNRRNMCDSDAYIVAALALSLALLIRNFICILFNAFSWYYRHVDAVLLVNNSSEWSAVLSVSSTHSTVAGAELSVRLYSVSAFPMRANERKLCARSQIVTFGKLFKFGALSSAAPSPNAVVETELKNGKLRRD